MSPNVLETLKKVFKFCIIFASKTYKNVQTWETFIVIKTRTIKFLKNGKTWENITLDQCFVVSTKNTFVPLLSYFFFLFIYISCKKHDKSIIWTMFRVRNTHMLFEINNKQHGFKTNKSRASAELLWLQSILSSALNDDPVQPFSI